MKSHITPSKNLNCWEHFEHAADIGIRGIGATCSYAFEQAALALTAIVTDLKNIQPVNQARFSCHAVNLELLLIEWLNSLIYEMSVSNMLFSHFSVTIRSVSLNAICTGEKLNVEKHHPVVEVKAATYDELRVFQAENGIWIAQCVVDV